MKHLGLIAALIVGFVGSASAEYVNGHYRKNGTYVQGYNRSDRDSSPYNNYSYPGNTNPYTGKTATGNEDTYLYNYYQKSSPNTSYGYEYPTIEAPRVPTYNPYSGTYE